MDQLAFHQVQAKKERSEASRQQRLAAESAQHIKEKRQQYIEQLRQRQLAIQQKYEQLQEMALCENDMRHYEYEYDELHDQLIEQEQQLQIAREQAEQANQQQAWDQAQHWQHEIQAQLETRLLLLEEQQQLMATLKQGEQKQQRAEQIAAAAAKQIMCIQEQIETLEKHIQRWEARRQQQREQMLASIARAEAHEVRIKQFKQQARLSQTQTQTDSPANDSFRSREGNNESAKADKEAENSTVVARSSAVTLTREEIKVRIQFHQNQAQQAQAEMMRYLAQQNNNQALKSREERDQQNTLAKQYSDLLQQIQQSSTQTAHNDDCNIVQTARNFQKSLQQFPHALERAQDPAHDNIMRCLLTHQHYASFTPSYVQAMLKNISGQKYNITQQQDIDRLQMSLPKNSQGRYVVGDFIRDAFKLSLETNEQTPLFFENFHISDSIAHSSFQRDFDGMVNKTNTHLNQHLNFDKTMEHFKGVGHRDAIQIIPKQNDHLGRRDHFLGACIDRPINIINNVIESPLRLQGIFASDGAFRSLIVRNNRIQVNGSHTISFNGVLSGCFQDNTNTAGEPLTMPQLKLLPLRLGGGSNIYITGFHEGSLYHYDTTDIPAEIDFRTRPSHLTKRGHASFYRNVHMEIFHDVYRAMLQSSRDQQYLNEQKQAVDRGEQAGIKGMPLLYYSIKLALRRLQIDGLAEEDLR
ncbi:MAG: hypothetical protein ACWA5U_08750 [bacterium]